MEGEVNMRYLLVELVGYYMALLHYIVLTQMSPLHVCGAMCIGTLEAAAKLVGPKSET
jgi:hypothetical protein